MHCQIQNEARLLRGEICTMLVMPTAVLKGGCYYNNMHINVSFRGKVTLCS